MTSECSGKRLLILGAGIMQGPAISIAKDMGLYTVVVDGDPRAPEAAKADRFECIDLKDKEGIQTLGATLQSHGGLAGVMTAGTDFSATVAWAAEKLGLPGIPYAAALNASNKDRMRRCFAAAGVPSPQFTTFTTKSLGRSPKKLPFDFPVVVKPVDNMGGRGCRRVNSSKELTDALPEALEFSRSGKAIVEEFMDGPEFSVDAIVNNENIMVCGFADRHIFYPPYFIEMGHTMPSAQDSAVIKSLLEVFFAGVRSLGISAGYGAAKGDLKLTARGPMIGEIAARLSGGYMSGWTYPYASGVEVTRGAILAALGRPWSPGPDRNRTSAERAFISIPGKVHSIHGLDQARKTRYVKNIFLRIAEGSLVRFPENNVTKCGNIISAAPSRKAAVNAAENAARKIVIRLDINQRETDAFLAFHADAFPPDAFSLPPDIHAALNSIPVQPIPDLLHAAAGDLPLIGIHPFPEFTGCKIRDYAGRTPRESLEIIRVITGLALPIMEGEIHGIVLDRNFWNALIRGGYQGGMYFIDTLLKKQEITRKKLNKKRGQNKL
ncbi:ATP-grasp domain-containing protein [Treponema primitia]|uniref:ATP-grasp domain-containing protein n=1 Tax=Treponema primitia TaxID=88058 RepID=UPI000571AA74|nr:ATP-grasp domain-containing protein [Treponema primitia]